MQAGFAFLECGSVRSKNATNILLKNVLDSCKFKKGEKNNSMWGKNQFSVGLFRKSFRTSWIIFVYTFVQEEMNSN